MQSQESNKTTVCHIDDHPNTDPCPLGNILGWWHITIVSNTNKKYGQLGGDGMLWNVEIIVKHTMVFKELDQAVKDNWRDALSFFELVWVIVLKFYMIKV